MTVAETADRPSTVAAPPHPTGLTEGAPDVEILDVTKRFGDVVAVDAMTPDPCGSFTSLLGPSGCGKTTTLRMIAGFEQPTAGEILLAGKPIAGVPPYRRSVNTVFQHYALFPHMDVAQNVGYGLRQKKVSKEEEPAGEGGAGAVRLGGYEKRRTWELSGGQQQRRARRALVNRPTVLLLDEPLGALDLKLRKAMQLELKALQQEVGITFVYVTHDQEEALTMSDVIVVMRDGLIQQLGGPRSCTSARSTASVADFIGVSNPIVGRITEFDVATRRASIETDRGLRLGGQVTDPAGSLPQATEDGRGPPERLTVEPAAAARPTAAGWTSVPGRINQGTYLGDQTEFRIDTDQAGVLIVRRQNAAGMGGGGPARGSRRRPVA